MKVLFIEPHPDDFILSAYYTCKKLCSDFRDLTLATVFPARVSDSKKLADYIGANYISNVHYPLSSLITWQERLNWRAVWNMSWEELLNHYINRVSLPNIDVLRHTIAYMCEYDEFDYVMTTMGLLHPEHILVSYVVDSVDCKADKLYVADFPYYATKKTARRIADNSPFSKYLTIEAPDSIKLEKLKLFQKFYKSETALIRRGAYYQVKDTPEVVYRRSD